MWIQMFLSPIVFTLYLEMIAIKQLFVIGRLSIAFLTLVNQLKPANPDSYIDLRVSSLIRLKPINGERRPDIKVCIGAGGYGVLLNDVLMKGNPKQLQKFIQEVLYDSLTPYEWLPSFIKEYLRDHPDEIDEYLPKSK